MKSIIAIALFLVTGIVHATEVSPLTVLGTYEITSPIAPNVVNHVELKVDNQIILVQKACEDTECQSLNCEGQYLLVNEVLVSSMVCEDKSFYTQSIILKGISLEALAAGQQTTAHSTLYGLGNAVPVVITKTK